MTYFVKLLKCYNVIMKNRPWLGYFLIFGLGFIVFLYVLHPPGILGPDSFYHTKMALMIKDQGLIHDFPWTQFTTYNDLFVDHHFGYHFLLIPFLKLPTPKNLDTFSAEIDPLIKAKLATAFFAALVFLIIYWFCRYLRIKKPIPWTLTGFLVSPFLLRLSLIRAPAISLLILILGFYFILRKKYLGLFILSFFYVWIYGTWPLMLITVFIYCLANAVKNLNQFPTSISKFLFSIKNLIYYFFSKNNLKLLSICILGLGAGLIINPYFPKTIPFYWFQTVKIAFLNYQNKVGVGAEWYPFGPETFFLSTLPILLPWIISFAWFIFSRKQQKTSSWFFAFLSSFFLLYTLKARRNIEYFVPSAIFFSGIIFSQIAEKINWLNIKNRFKRYFQGPENIFYFITTIFLIILICFFLGFYLNSSIKKLHNSYVQSRPLDYLQKASYWLKNNTQKGEIVFQSKWSIFPELFYFNTQNYYINGLDQTFMYEKNKNLYQTWLDLVSHKVSPDQTAQILKEKFQASYVLVDKGSEKFGKLLKKSKSLKEVYQDEQVIIYEVDSNYVY